MNELVLVDAADLRDVLAVVPSPIPMGWHGDDKWTPESVAAKRRLLAKLEEQNA